MATNQENLQAALASATTALAALYAKPKPNYSIDGRSYSWNEMRKSILDELKTLREQIQAEDSPFEVVSFGQ